MYELFIYFFRIGMTQTPEIIDRRNNVNYHNLTQFILIIQNIHNNQIESNREEKASFSVLEKLHKTTNFSKNSLLTNKTNQFVYLSNKSKQAKQNQINAQEAIYKPDKKNMHPKLK